MASYDDGRRGVILKQYNTLREEINQRKDYEKSSMDAILRNFHQKLADIEDVVIKKIREMREVGQRTLLEVCASRRRQTTEKIHQLDKLLESVTKSEEWCEVDQLGESGLTKLQSDLREHKDKFSNIEGPTSILEMHICTHVTNFINKCDRIFDYSSNEVPPFTCCEHHNIADIVEDNTSSSAFVQVTGRRPSISHNGDFLEDWDQITNPDKQLHDEEPIALIEKIEDAGSLGIVGQEYGCLKTLARSKAGIMVALDVDQRAFFTFNKTGSQISKIKQYYDAPHDGAFLDNKEILVYTVAHKSRACVLRVAALAGNGKSLRKIVFTNIDCNMKEHCVAVRTLPTKRNLVCIACPKELRCCYLDEHGKLDLKSPPLECQLNAGEDIQFSKLETSRYAVELNKDANEVFYIKSDQRKVVCTKIGSLGIKKWTFKRERTLPVDMCIFQSHLLVTDNFGNAILELETDKGTLLQSISLVASNLDITSPFAICVCSERQQILLTQYSICGGRDPASKRKQIRRIRYHPIDQSVSH